MNSQRFTFSLFTEHQHLRQAISLQYLAEGKEIWLDGFYL